MEAKEEIRSRLNIEDVIGEYVELKRAGRNFKGLSPFTDEKTPSFVVSPEKQIWHDFSSNRGGDVFSFVMEAEGMDFRQALEKLARKAGVELTQFESQGSRELAQKKQRLYEVHELAAKYFMTSMIRNQKAISYVFKQRALSRDVVQEFEIGYAPDSGQALTTFLLIRGFDKRELSDAGLINRYGGDLFRGRMMVPLMDGGGRVIGFTGRIIGDVENAPKYLNTPQTLIYDKGRHVFGLSQAKEAIRKAGYSVIVEGNLDVVSSHQVDVKQVVATAGTALTEHHLRALHRLTSDIRLCFDGDKAGLAAAERAVGIASTLDVQLSIISLPDDVKDPDELIQKHGAAAWLAAIDARQPAIEWVIAQYQARYDIQTADGKRTFSTEVARLLKAISDEVEREHYEKVVADLLNVSLKTLRTKTTQSEPEKPRKKVVQHGEAPDAGFAYEDDFLAAAMLDARGRELLGRLDSAMLHGEGRQKIAAELAKSPDTPLDSLPKELLMSEIYVKIFARAELRYGAWSEEDRFMEAARLMRQVQNQQRKQMQDELTQKLRDAELAGDDHAADALRAELNALIKEIARG